MIFDTNGSLVTEENDIIDLGLSNRAYNALRRIGIQTVGDLDKMPVESILSIRNIGVKSYHEVIDKLDEWRDGLGEEEVDWHERSNELEAENVRLRELCADMWNGMCGYAHDCRDCDHYELYEGHRFAGECKYWRRMRELGIEVD